MDRRFYHQTLSKGFDWKYFPQPGIEGVRCKFFVQISTNLGCFCVESNNCFAWLYDVCNYGTLYPEHENYGQKAKGDLMIVMTFHISQIAGEKEVFRIFGPLWQALMRLANGVLRRSPECETEDKSAAVGKKGKREGGYVGRK